MDEVEFNAWVAPHLPALRAVAARAVGNEAKDDIVQEALLRAWLRRSTYRAERGSVRAWLVAIVLDQARRQTARRRWGDELPLFDELPSTSQPLPERLDVERAVRDLPRRQREAVTLHYLADLAVDEVAALMGISSGTVKAHLSAARTSVRNAWERT